MIPTQSSAAATAPAPAPVPAPMGGLLSVNTLAPPAAGALSVPVQQLAGQAVVASTITAMLPLDYAMYQSLTLDQLVELIRRRLAALEATGAVSPSDSAALMLRFDAVRRGEEVRRPRADRRVPPSAVTVAGIVAAVAPPAVPPDLEGADFLGDVLGFFQDALAVLEGALGGFAVAGIPGAVVGGITAYTMLQHEDGFLTA